MTLRKNAEKIHDLDILDEIEKNPNATQATMANQMNVAIGTVNWHLKRLIDKGYVQIQRCEKKKLKYLITPEGISLRAKLTVDYIHSSFEMYRLIRQRILRIRGTPVQFLRRKPRKKCSIYIVWVKTLRAGCRTTIRTMRRQATTPE